MSGRNDLVVKNVMLVDGTGSPARPAEHSLIGRQDPASGAAQNPQRRKGRRRDEPHPGPGSSTSTRTRTCRSWWMGAHTARSLRASRR